MWKLLEAKNLSVKFRKSNFVLRPLAFEINNGETVAIIGESGSGKSTIMKVLSLCRWIYKRVVLRSYVKQANIKKTGIGIQMRTLLKTSQINEYLTPPDRNPISQGRL